MITFAGSSTSGFLDGTGTNALMNGVAGVAIDSIGNVYAVNGGFTGGHTIRVIDTNKIVTVLAGANGLTGNVNGIGTNARFATVFGIAVDTNLNVYVADYGNQNIRQITAGGVVTTVATGALFQGVVVASTGLIFAAEQNSMVSIISSGVRTVLAGAAGSSSRVDGQGTVARFNDCAQIGLSSSGNILFVSDYGNHAIRAVTTSGNEC